MTDVREHNARTGTRGPVVAQESTSDEIHAACARAAEASKWLATRTRQQRAALLREFAGGLESRSGELVAVADRETALGEVRLTGELTRTAHQLRFMAEVIEEGSYLDLSIEHPRPTFTGMSPDLRRTSVPVGPVVVFGASNFPFAFSAPGGDTASALAAGCAVLVKAHSSHPAVSVLVAEIFHGICARLSVPTSVFQVLFGRSAGVELVENPNVAAVGFTGSVSGGRALFNAAMARPNPIPFYGELGSVNPLVVTSGAAKERWLEIASGIAASMTLGMGQFCTKPGIFFIPAGDEGDLLVSELASASASVDAGYLLNDGILETFRGGTSALQKLGEVSVLVARRVEERKVSPILISINAPALSGPYSSELTQEYFGPLGIVVRYTSIEEIEVALGALPPALTGTLHTAGEADADAVMIASMLESRSGRLVFNGYPTGVAVSWGMNHGGQYPASTSYATSVGAGSIRRWIRPLTYQDAPLSMLPPELAEDNDLTLPRRIDGVLRGAAS